MLKPCLDCGTPTSQSRCPACAYTRTRARNARRTQYHGSWATTARRVVAEHRARHGDWCPGYGTPAHHATDLTCDHVADGSLGVLCRSCNARKGALEPVFTRPR